MYLFKNFKILIWNSSFFCLFWNTTEQKFISLLNVAHQNVCHSSSMLDTVWVSAFIHTPLSHLQCQNIKRFECVWMPLDFWLQSSCVMLWKTTNTCHLQTSKNYKSLNIYLATCNWLNKQEQYLQSNRKLHHLGHHSQHALAWETTTCLWAVCFVFD